MELQHEQVEDSVSTSSSPVVVSVPALRLVLIIVDIEMITFIVQVLLNPRRMSEYEINYVTRSSIVQAVCYVLVL